MHSVKASSSDPIAVISDRPGLGDGVRLLPLFAWIKQRYPERTVWWIVSNERIDVLRANVDLLEGHVDRLISIPIFKKKIAEAMLALRALPRFHRIFDVRTRIADVLAASLFLRCDRRITCLPFYLLSDALPPSGRRRAKNNADRYWSLAEADAGRSMDWYATFSGSLVLPERALALARTLFPLGHRYAGIVLSTVAPEARAWGLDNFLELGRALPNLGFKPVYFVGPTEWHHVPLIREHVPEAIINEPRYAGEGADIFRIQLVAAAMKQMTFAISTDTGPGHLFGLLGVPLISLFGSSNPPDKAAAFSRSLTVLRAKDAQGVYSMDALNVSMVLAAVRSLTCESHA